MREDLKQILETTDRRKAVELFQEAVWNFDHTFYYSDSFRVREHWHSIKNDMWKIGKELNFTDEEKQSMLDFCKAKWNAINPNLLWDDVTHPDHKFIITEIRILIGLDFKH